MLHQCAILQCSLVLAINEYGRCCALKGKLMLKVGTSLRHNGLDGLYVTVLK